MSDTSAPTSNIKDHDLLTFHPGDFREATKLHVSELLAALSAACGSCSVDSQQMKAKSLKHGIHGKKH